MIRRKRPLRVPAIIRRVSDPLLADVRVPILSGVNRGMRWSLISAGSGYGSGRRARDEMELLAALVWARDVVWDVGAHHGYVTLGAARRARVVHAFEPAARNREMLRRHVRWNGLTNVVVHPFALSDTDSECCFGGNGTSKMYALGGGRELVQVRTACTLVAEGICPPPTFAKIDVEGAEADALTGAMPVLPRCARLLIAMHSAQTDERCTALLGAAGFELVASGALERSRRGPWRSDPSLFCRGPEAEDGEGDLRILRALRF